MKQFDIYLRNRITELDVAIRELSLRNDITIKAEIYLLVDDILSTAEKFVSIYGDGELATDEGVIICTRDGREIVASNKYLPNFILDSSCGATAKTVYERIQSISQLISEAGEMVSTKATGEIRNDMRLESDTITLLQEWFYSCSALRNTLTSSSEIFTGVEKFVSIYGDGELETDDGAIICTRDGEAIVASNKYLPNFILNSSNASAEKIVAERIENALTLTYAIGCTLEYLLGIEEQNKLTLSSTANALLTRYRILGEMDKDTESEADLTLEEFDDMTLEDIDFVVIE